MKNSIWNISKKELWRANKTIDESLGERYLWNLRMLLNGVEWRMHTKVLEGEKSSIG